MAHDIDWLSAPNIRPYVFMRKENLFESPGDRHSCPWFPSHILYKDPLRMSEVGFADQILHMEGLAFQQSDMKMPRWVFYDCAIIPGFVCGFAQKTASLPPEVRKVLAPKEDLDWTPLSLFIIIPTTRPGEWVAHNLCTVNSLLPPEAKYYALGFLSKAFGLWYANVEILCGMTQWQSPSIRLHSHYGAFQILTAYTPVHSYARTLTYRSRVNFEYWKSFFSKNSEGLTASYEYAGFTADPRRDESLIQFQQRIESGEGPFYFNPTEIRTQPLEDPVRVYRLAREGGTA